MLGARVALAIAAFGFGIPYPAAGQIQLVPTALEPGQWERIALRVVNQAGPNPVRVRIEVPQAVYVMGADAPDGWEVVVTPPTDTSAAAIEWSGGPLPAGGFREFAFLGRLAADVRQNTLVFPVAVWKDNGDSVAWRRGGEAPPPRIAIQGSTRVSSWGALAVAGVALGVASLAVVLAMHRR